jgi:superfamily II DNA helicase RecQ
LTLGKYTHVVATIEQFVKDPVKQALSKILIAALVVDEAHIPSKWRKIKSVYDLLRHIRAYLSMPPYLLSTATATASTR